MRRSRHGCLVALATLVGCSQALLEDDAGHKPTTGPSVDAMVFPDAVPLPPLSVDYADPPHGPFVGGTDVTLRGRGFASGMTVTIGGRLVDPMDLQVLDGHRALIKTPPGSPGSADIAVVAGANQTTRTGGFTYDRVFLEPASGSTAGGTFVKVRGLGTTFQAGVTVTFDGAAMTGLEVVNGQELSGYAPPGEPGPATVEVKNGADAPIVVTEGYLYEDTVDAFSGGFGGGLLDGTLNVTIIDNYTGDGVPFALVVVGDPATAQYKGLTDPFGQITFSGPGLTGQQTITAGHKKYESGAFVGFDAQNATMFLSPLPPDPTDPPPDTGPFPPGKSPGTVSGDIVFGGTTGIGSDTSWDLVPDPTQPGEVKRTYVFTTARDIFSTSADPGPGGTVDYAPGQDAWHYSIPVRPSAFALVAVAGLYNPNVDPDGAGPLPKGVFVPYAMGVLRNLVAGSGEIMANVAIPINIPLDTAIIVKLDGTPEIGATGVPGPDQYQVAALIDLGGEGVIRLPGGRATFRDKPKAILTGMAPIAGAISDASYTFVAGAYTSVKLAPYSVRIVRGVRDLSTPVVIDGFLGVPRAVDPPADGTSTMHHLVLRADGGTTAPTFYYHRVQTTEGIPVFRVLARGDRLEVPLYDLTALGLPPLTNKPLFWSVTAVTIPGETFDTFSYDKLNANLWAAYASDSYGIAFP
jgi:hypothetical protein